MTPFQKELQAQRVASRALVELVAKCISQHLAANPEDREELTRLRGLARELAGDSLRAVLVEVENQGALIATEESLS
jgi:hypothetical protein